LSYDYSKERAYIFTEEGQREFLKIRDRVRHLLDYSGSCTVGKAIETSTGSSWSHLACIDRLVELGEIRYVNRDGWTQFHVIAAPFR